MKKSILLSDLKIIVEALESGEIITTDILSLINKQNKIKEKTDEIKLTIDYSRTVREMINAGKFDWINEGITKEHFPLPNELSGKKVPVSTVLFYFNRAISGANAVFEMDKAGYRPATLAELLALAETHPELQQEFFIVALGSRWSGEGAYRDVSVLFFSESKRKLGLGSFPASWLAHCRFLAVRR